AALRCYHPDRRLPTRRLACNFRHIPRQARSPGRTNRPAHNAHPRTSMLATRANHLRLLRTAVVLLALLASPTLAHAGEALFETDVLPVLAKNCLGCHGGLRQRGGLDLRTLAALRKGGDSGVVVKPGDARASALWTRVASDEMPPGEHKLSASEKKHL